MILFTQKKYNKVLYKVKFKSVNDLIFGFRLGATEKYIIYLQNESNKSTQVKFISSKR